MFLSFGRISVEYLTLSLDSESQKALYCLQVNMSPFKDVFISTVCFFTDAHIDEDSQRYGNALLELLFTKLMTKYSYGSQIIK